MEFNLPLFQDYALSDQGCSATAIQLRRETYCVAQN
jgi:hypothetical protein